MFKNLKKYKFVFTSEVSVNIILYLNEAIKYNNKRVKYSDLDNYIKIILDCLKGKDGILIDDSQIQSLSISWIDITNTNEYFDILIKSHIPDCFVRKPIKLYEMPDKLFYPISEEVSRDIDVIKAIYEMIKASENVKVKFKDMNDKNYYTQMLKPFYSIGFHKSHIIDSKFDILLNS